MAEPVRLEIILDDKASAGLRNFGAIGDKLAETFERKVAPAAEKASSSFFNLSTVSGIVHTAMAALAAIGFERLISGIVETSSRMEALQRSMNAAAGSTIVGGEAMAFVRAESNRLGLELVSTTNAYKGLLAATVQSGRSAADAQIIFTGVAEAATALGSSMQDTEGALIAVQQIMGKGKVQMQELELQLGQRFPGAVGILAQSLHVTTAELFQMMAAGQLTSSVLVGFGQQLHTQFGGAALLGAQAWPAVLNRFKNAWTDMASAIGSGGLLSMVTSIVSGITTILNNLVASGVFRDLGEVFKDLGAGIKTHLENLGAWVKTEWPKIWADAKAEISVWAKSLPKIIAEAGKDISEAWKTEQPGILSSFRILLDSISNAYEQWQKKTAEGGDLLEQFFRTVLPASMLRTEEEVKNLEKSAFSFEGAWAQANLGLTRGIEGIGKGFSAASKAAGEFLSGIEKSQVAEPLQKAADVVTTLGKTLITVGADSHKFADSVGEIGDEWEDALKKAEGGATGVDAALKKVSGEVQATGEAATEAADRASKAILNTGETGGKVLVQLTNGVFTQMDRSALASSQNVARVLEKTTEGFLGVGQVANQTMSKTDLMLVQLTDGTITQIDRTLLASRDDIKRSVDDTNSHFSQMSGKGVDTSQKVADAMTAMGLVSSKSVQRFMNDAINNFNIVQFAGESSGVKLAEAWVDKVLPTILAAMGKIPPGMKTLAEEMRTNLQVGVSQGVQGAAEALKKLDAALLDAFGKLPPSVHEAAEQMRAFLVKGAADGVEGAAEALKKLDEALGRIPKQAATAAKGTTDALNLLNDSRTVLQGFSTAWASDIQGLIQNLGDLETAMQHVHEIALRVDADAPGWSTFQLNQYAHGIDIVKDKLFALEQGQWSVERTAIALAGGFHEATAAIHTGMTALDNYTYFANKAAEANRELAITLQKDLARAYAVLGAQSRLEVEFMATRAVDAFQRVRDSGIETASRLLEIWAQDVLPKISAAFGANMSALPQQFRALMNEFGRIADQGVATIQGSLGAGGALLATIRTQTPTTTKVTQPTQSVPKTQVEPETLTPIVSVPSRSLTIGRNQDSVFQEPGIVMRPTMANIDVKRGPELIAPLRDLPGLLPRGGNTSVTINATINLNGIDPKNLDATRIVRELTPALKEAQRRGEIS